VSKIVFVDGPNGVGKDYFIANLAKLLAENNKTYIIKGIKDYMPKDNPIINIRQFSKEFFKTSFYNTDVLDAHIKCVDDVIKTAEQEEYDYILVNRSIVSYIIYNLVMPRMVMNMHGNIYEEINKISEEQYVKVDFGMIRIIDRLLNVKSQTYLFLLYDTLTENQIIKRMEDTRGIKFSDYEHLILIQILDKYAEIYNTRINQFYYFSKKDIIKSSEYELAYKLTADTYSP
jgi:thymidylate kinase